MSFQPTTSRNRRGNNSFAGRRFGSQNNSGASRSRGRGRSKKSSIDPSRFVNAATDPATTTPYTPVRQFRQFAFHPKMHEAIRRKGYDAPTAIQDQAIPHILAGRDVVGIADTGSGKTASFILPLINRLLADPERMALVVAPTRELANQIDEEFRSFTGGLPLRSAVCVGGLREGPQIRALKQSPQMIIGTPGRLKDFVENKHLNLSRCSMFVLDEADRMLDMGFIHDMKFLMRHLPEVRQSLCFSATITPEIERIIATLLTEPKTVSVRTSRNNSHIEQQVVQAVTPIEKFSQLQRLLSEPEWDKVLVFGETKYGVQRLSEKLTKNGIASGAIHGNRNQNQRQKTLNSFKNGQLRVLVATDVAARGIDIDDVSHVINYDTPGDYDTYIHRIGRTGRAGKRGHAVTFVS